MKSTFDLKTQKMKVLANTQSASDVRQGKGATSTVRQLMAITPREKVKEPRIFELAPEDMPLSPKVTNFERLKENMNVVLMISSKMERNEITIPRNLNINVKEFKDKHFESDMQGGTVGVRLIYNGKEMRDSHLLSDHNIVENSNIYVFFFKKEDKIRRETTLANKSEADFNNVTDTEGLDFDYFKEKQNLTVDL